MARPYIEHSRKPRLRQPFSHGFAVTAPLKGEPLMWVLLCLSVEQWRKPEEASDRKGRPYAGVSGSDRVQHGPGDPAPTHFFRWFVGAGFPRPSAEVSSSVRVGSRKIRERQKIPPVR